jgi:HEAT repeat protein
MGLRRQTIEPLREVVARRHPRDLDGLLAQLQSGDADERRWAARDLAAHPQAAQRLAERLLRERDLSVRDACFTSLGSIGTDAAAAALEPLLRSDDAGLRNGAIEALAAMPAPAARRMDHLLRDTDPDVRIFAVNLLGDLVHDHVPAWLDRVLREERAVNVVAAAIEVIAEVGGAANLPALRTAAHRFPDEPFIGFAADMAADRIAEN